MRLHQYLERVFRFHYACRNYFIAPECHRAPVIHIIAGSIFCDRLPTFPHMLKHRRYFNGKRCAATVFDTRQFPVVRQAPGATNALSCVRLPVVRRQKRALGDLRFHAQGAGYGTRF
jgi:hypothetical protein